MLVKGMMGLQTGEDGALEHLLTVPPSWAYREEQEHNLFLSLSLSLSLPLFLTLSICLFLPLFCSVSISCCSLDERRGGERRGEAGAGLRKLVSGFCGGSARQALVRWIGKAGFGAVDRRWISVRHVATQGRLWRDGCGVVMLSGSHSNTHSQPGGQTSESSESISTQLQIMPEKKTSTRTLTLFRPPVQICFDRLHD